MLACYLLKVYNVPVSNMPMKNSINTEMRQRMWKELVNGRAVWKTVKSVQTDIMKVDTRVRSSVRPAEIECISCI